MAKIGIIGDTHLGYRRFREDAITQAREAFKRCNQECDFILLAGDVFDTSLPSLEDIWDFVSICSECDKEVIAIHGNHDRRSSGKINAVKLVGDAGIITYLHNSHVVRSFGDERLNIVGLGSVPEEYSKQAIEKCTSENPPKKGSFNIFMFHQDVNVGPIKQDHAPDVDELLSLGYDLVVDGHIHGHHNIDNRFIIPGSTVVTQLRDDESGSRGYVVYDTKSKSAEFREIPCRKVLIKRLEFENAGKEEVEKAVREHIGRVNEGEIAKIILSGTLREGMKPSDLTIPKSDCVFIDNRLNHLSLRESIEKIRKISVGRASSEEIARRRLSEILSGKVSFDPGEFFDALLEGDMEAEEFVSNILKLRKQSETQ